MENSLQNVENSPQNVHKWKNLGPLFGWLQKLILTFLTARLQQKLVPANASEATRRPWKFVPTRLSTRETLYL